MTRILGAVRRLAWLVIALVIVLVAAGSGLLAVLTMRGLPTTNGTLAIDGLERGARVTRDASGIAMISAETSHDLFLAQGYVHAQDRMWQMEVWRHISAGRLSELFGASTLSEDRFIRTLGWRQAAARDLAALSPEARAAVDAYAEGVNAWIADHRGALSLPFVVTAVQSGLGGIGGYDLEPWTALDTLAWQKVQSWQLGGNFDSEIFRMLADPVLGDASRTDELFPAYDDAMPVITPSGLKGSGGAGAAAAPPRDVARGPGDEGGIDVGEIGDPAAWRDLAATGGRILEIAGLDAAAGIAGDHQIGSNNWVVAPSKSTTKGALLGNDPHLAIGMPSVWYMNGLRCRTISAACPFDVVGVTFPGVPGVILGHNAKIAWGATNVDPDVQDLFSIEPDPADPAAYLVAGKSVPYEVRRETIKVAGKEPVQLEVRSTIHGPVVNDVDDRLADDDDAPLLALRWTATDAVDGTFEAIFRVNTSATFEEFREAFRTYGAPSQNFVYADVAGHIGYVLPGRIPIREDPADRGARIRSGSDGKHDWTGVIPFEDLPWQLDPADGLIVTANNAAVDGEYPYFVAAEWDIGHRAKRIRDLLEAAARDGGISVATTEAIQADTRVLRAGRIAPLVAEARPETEDGALLADRILDWTGFDCPTDSLGCAAYHAFEYRLLRAVFDDDLGALAREYVGGGASWQALLNLADQPDSPWWDDVASRVRRETRDGIVGAALDAAGRELRAALGGPGGWTWGALHQARFAEPTLGSSGIGPLEWYFDQGPFAAPGAPGAVNNVYVRPSRAYPDPLDPAYVPVDIRGVFGVTNLPSYRFAIDMKDLDGARIVQTTGQSGNPFDRHYGDLIDEWLTGQTVSLPFSLAAVSGAALETLQLAPRR